MNSLKRIQREYQLLKTAPLDNLRIELNEETILNEWTSYLKGPTATPYEGGNFKLNIRFRENYPFNPPVVKFVTKIYHPNISETGAICLDVLKEQWSPALSMEKVLLSISSLLEDPNPEDPLAPEPARLYLENKDEYNRVAKEWTNNYAK